MRYAIKCVTLDGHEEYVMHFKVGERGRIALFSSKREATERADFLKIGVAEEYQSINVVRYSERQVRP